MHSSHRTERGRGAKCGRVGYITATLRAWVQSCRGTAPDPISPCADKPRCHARATSHAPLLCCALCTPSSGRPRAGLGDPAGTRVASRRSARVRHPSIRLDKKCTVRRHVPGGRSQSGREVCGFRDIYRWLPWHSVSKWRGRRDGACVCVCVCVCVTRCTRTYRCPSTSNVGRKVVSYGVGRRRW